MSAQVGIPNYKDLVNKEYLERIKNKINIICVSYGKLANNDAIENRESDDFEKYSNQYENDLYNLHTLIRYAQELVTELNNTSFTISTRSINNHHGLL